MTKPPISPEKKITYMIVCWYSLVSLIFLAFGIYTNDFLYYALSFCFMVLAVFELARTSQQNCVENWVNSIAGSMNEEELERFNKSWRCVAKASDKGFDNHVKSYKK